MEAGQDNLTGMLYGDTKVCRGRIPFSDLIGTSMDGGRILLESGPYFLHASITINPDDLTIEGRDETTVLYVMGDYTITWAGDRGRLERIRIEDGRAALAPRLVPTFAILVTGTDFKGYDLRIHGTANGIRLVAGADRGHLIRCRITGQTSVGIDALADGHCLFDCEAQASAAAAEINSTGAASWVGACRVTGGTINIAGAGSVNAGNFV